MQTMLRQTKPSVMPSSADFFGVGSEKVADWWDQVQPLLEPALAHASGCYMPSDVLNALLGKDMQLWIAVVDLEVKTFWITEIVQYPRKKVCLVHFCGGRLEDVEAFKDHIIDWARCIGCHGIQLFGRKGWRKTLPDWKENAVILSKELCQ